MSLNYNYPSYNIDLTTEMLDQCCDIGVRLLKEVGLAVRHEKFLNIIRKKEGVRIAGGRVYFKEALVRRNIEEFVTEQKKHLEENEESSSAQHSVDLWEAGLNPKEKVKTPKLQRNRTATEKNFAAKREPQRKKTLKLLQKNEDLAFNRIA